MRRLMTVVLAAAIGMAGCADAFGPDRGRQFVDAYTKWQAHEPAHYGYTLELSCFCIFPEYGPVAVRVKDGAVESATFTLSGLPADTAVYSSYATVERLFGVVADALEHADSVAVDYDPTYGVPVRVSIDRFLNAVDDELGVRVTAFAALP